MSANKVKSKCKSVINIYNELSASVFLLFLLFPIRSVIAFPSYIDEELDPFASKFSYDFYKNQTAEFKLNVWWEFIKEKEGTKVQYSYARLAAMFLEDLNPTMDFDRDYRPWAHLKAIHTIGAVSKIVFNNIQDHDFTGFFQEGSQYGLIRLGGTIPAIETFNFIPGLGIKFFRDGSPSADVVMLTDQVYQHNLNFFQEYQSNHIRKQRWNRPDLKFVQIKFATASKPSEMVGITDFAKSNSTGIPLPADEVVSPFRIIMIAEPRLKNDFEGISSEKKLLEKLESIPSGTLLYRVYGMIDPESEFPGIRIGEISTASEMIFSENADQYLHFRHQRMTDDLDYNEDWFEHVCPGQR